MNAEKCLQILREIKDVAFATVDESGKPQIRIIDIMLVDSEKLYFCTARGKSFYHQLMKGSNVAITGINQFLNLKIFYIRVRDIKNKLGNYDEQRLSND